MTGRLSFFVPCNPPRTTKQAHTHTRVVGAYARVYADAEGDRLEADLREILRAHVPAEPYAVAVACVVEVVWGWNVGDLKRDRAVGQVAHGTIPDADNYAKQVLDCMTRLRYWRDDGLVADLRITKRRARVAGMGVSVWPVDARDWPLVCDGYPREAAPLESGSLPLFEGGVL